MVDYKPLPDDAAYICGACAKKYGWKAPPDHLGTMHVGTCDVCHDMWPLLNVGDWNWPDGKRRGMRD